MARALVTGGTGGGPRSGPDSGDAGGRQPAAWRLLGRIVRTWPG